MNYCSFCHEKFKRDRKSVLKQKGGVIQFPLAFTIREKDLLYPLTPNAWATDERKDQEIGIAATIDTDGRIVTGSKDDLIGFGISKPVTLGAQIERTEAVIKTSVRANFRGYTQEQETLLYRLDDEMDRRKGTTVDPLSLKPYSKPGPTRGARRLWSR